MDHIDQAKTASTSDALAAIQAAPALNPPEERDAKREKRAAKEKEMSKQPALRGGKIFGAFTHAEEKMRVQGVNFRATERHKSGAMIPFKKKIDPVNLAEAISRLPKEQFHARAVSWKLNLLHLSQALGLPVHVGRQMVTHARFMSQIGEEIAQIFFDLNLHKKNKDFPGSDGYRLVEEFHHMVSIKNAGEKRKPTIQFSSLTGRHGIYCDMQALRECIDNTHSIIIVDAYDVDSLWLTETPTRAFLQWMDLGFFDAGGLRMSTFYQLVKQTCSIDKSAVTLSQRRAALKALAKTMDSEHEAVELSKAEREPYDPFA